MTYSLLTSLLVALLASCRPAVSTITPEQFIVDSKEYVDVDLDFLKDLTKATSCQRAGSKSDLMWYRINLSEGIDLARGEKVDKAMSLAVPADKGVEYSASTQLSSSLKPQDSAPSFFKPNGFVGNVRVIQIKSLDVVSKKPFCGLVLYVPSSGNELMAFLWRS